jgi:DNA invertase Pin-like site-specific DNA recombinase
VPDERPLDGYVRVSSVGGREGESYISPSVQRDAITRWAEYKGIPILEWHQDEDWSGGTHERPGLERAVQRALDGETGGIVSWKIDRFSRNTEHGLRDLRRLQAKDARLVFVVEDVDTGTVYGRMVYTILLAVSEAFLENVKAGWRIAKERAVDRGAYISRTPFGYQRCEDGTLEPDADAAPIVQEAFRLAASDTLTRAVDYLNGATDRRWTTTTIRRLLSGRSYLGETRQGDRVAKDTHEPLVSRPVWEAAQSSPVSRGGRGEFPLSGIAKCASCGAPLIGGRGGKGQRTYRCSASSSTHRGGKCTGGPVITASILEDYVREVLEDLVGSFQARVGDPEADALTLLERGVNEAEAELDAFASDLTLRRALGDRYHTHLQERVEAVQEAQAAYRERARSAQTSVALTAPDLLDNPRLFAAGLRSIFDAIVVKRGRGLSVEDRVRLVPLHGDRPAGIFGTEGA